MLESIKNKGRGILLPIARLLARKDISPNWLTLIGLSITVVSAFLYGKGLFPLAGIILLVSGLFDVLDGDVARLSGKVTKSGAFLDSTTDRYADFAVLAGITFYYTKIGIGYVIIALLLILGSFMVSYTRARAEGFGIECKIGFGDRPVRFITIIIGSLFGSNIFFFFMLFLMAATNLTAIYRISYVLKRLKTKD
jgi:CDP-diacylglycerol--glycerol-3-phosphate 3-phosphatidyltransferase